MLTLDRSRLTDDELLADAMATHARIGRDERALLRRIAEMDERGVWEDSGARDYPHFLSMRLGISPWKARRLIAAAQALEDLPETSVALETGRASLDKVVEIARFATPETEGRVFDWADGVSPYELRLRGDVELTRTADEVARHPVSVAAVVVRRRPVPTARRSGGCRGREGGEGDRPAGGTHASDA
jgi:hypothetical protein